MKTGWSIKEVWNCCFIKNILSILTTNSFNVSSWFKFLKFIASTQLFWYDVHVCIEYCYMPWNTNLQRTIIPLPFYKQNHAYCNTVMWNLGSSFVFGCLFLWFVNFMAGKTEKSGPHLISRPAEPRKITHTPPPSLTTPRPILHSWRSKSANDLHFHLYLLLLKPSFTALRGYLRFQPIRCQFLLSEFGWILWHVFFKHLKWSASEYL